MNTRKLTLICVFVVAFILLIVLNVANLVVEDLKFIAALVLELPEIEIPCNILPLHTISIPSAYADDSSTISFNALMVDKLTEITFLIKVLFGAVVLIFIVMLFLIVWIARKLYCCD